jgi:hypothetical protein
MVGDRWSRATPQSQPVQFLPLLQETKFHTHTIEQVDLQFGIL